TFAVSGDPALIFEFSEFSAAQLALFGPDACPMLHHFDYPPTLLFFSYFLGFMPFLVAFAVWNLATLFLYQGAAYAIIPRPVVLIAAVTPIAVPVNISLGHNGLLTAALMGLSLAFMERRP